MVKLLTFLLLLQLYKLRELKKIYGPSNGPWWPASKTIVLEGLLNLYTVHAQLKLLNCWYLDHLYFFVGWGSMREALRPIPMRKTGGPQVCYIRLLLMLLVHKCVNQSWSSTPITCCMCFRTLNWYFLKAYVFAEN